MYDISINLYKTFCVVAQSKNYVDASNKLHISTTAISKNIRQLESLLGTTLFYREKDGVKLTGAGQEFFKYAEQGLATLNLGEKLIMQKSDLATGEIAIGCLSHLTTFYLMDYIEKVKIDYPDLKINLISGANFDKMIQMLEEHKLDFIIDTTQVDTNYNNLVIEEIKEVQNIFISNKPIKIKDLKELESQKYILNFEYSSTIKKLRNILKQHNVEIESNMQCDITELRVEATKRGLGIGYVMKEAVKNELENKELYEVELPIELPKSKINLIYIKEQLTQADKKFIKEYLKK